MSPTARRIGRVRDAIDTLAVFAVVALVLVMVAVTGSQVGLRYIFNQPLRWSEELARYVFVWLSFLGAYVAYRRSAHLGLDLFSEMLPEAARERVRLLAQAVIVATLLWALATSGRLLTVSMNQTSAVLGLPMVWVYAAFIVGAVLIVADVLLDWAGRLLSPGSGSALET